MAYIDVSGLPGISILAGIDPVTRDMFFSANTVGATVHPIDVYKEMRICRRLIEALRGVDVFLTAFGNVAKGGGKSTERYVRQNSGTRFVPYDISHTLTINGTIITDDGQEGVACFDRGPLTLTTVVDIAYVPPQVEIITVASPDIAAIKQQTDKLTFTKGNELDVNVKSQNDATLHGTGIDSDRWRGTP